MQLSNNTSVTFTLAHSCCIDSHKLLVVYVPVACSLAWSREEECGSNFLVCVWNPVLRPFKQYFFKAAYARCYLISVLLVRKRNEWILIPGTHANERIRVWASYFENAVWICDKQRGHTLNYRDGPSKKLWRFFFASAGYFLGLLRVYDFFIEFPLARRTSPPNPNNVSYGVSLTVHVKVTF